MHNRAPHKPAYNLALEPLPANPDPHAADPHLAAVPLPHSALYYPLGFPARIESNHPAVLEAANTSWNGLPPRFDAAPVTLRLVVSPSPNHTLPPPPTFRAQRHLLLLAAGAANSACCDLDSGFGAAWLAESTALAAEYLRYYFLEAMALTLIEARHLVSLHAACVARHGRGLLLCGGSGAGKSSLAFACALDGFTYIADDCSSLLRARPTRTVIGSPHLIRFRHTAVELFPQLAVHSPCRRANGDLSIELPTAHLPHITTAHEAPVDAILVLDRSPLHPSPASLVPIPLDQARPLLCPIPWPPELSITREREQTFARLRSVPVFRLLYRDLASAVARCIQLTPASP
jgi:hypothetical protein